MNKNITMSINVIFMGMLMTIMSNFSVLRFIDSFYSCITTCLCQVNIHQMFDKWKPLFFFLSKMIFVTFQNTFIAQTSKCFKGELRGWQIICHVLIMKVLLFYWKGNVHTSAVDDHTISVFRQLCIYDEISVLRKSRILRLKHITLNELDLSLSTTIYECSHLPCIQICQKGKCFKNEHSEQQNE